MTSHDLAVVVFDSTLFFLPFPAMLGECCKVVVFKHILLSVLFVCFA